MAYIPTFTTKTKTAAFLTNNPATPDVVSLPVVITDITVDEARGAILVKCSDRNEQGTYRVRTCLYGRLNSEKMVRSLQKLLQAAYDQQVPIQFVAAGGNSADKWFYTIK